MKYRIKESQHWFGTRFCVEMKLFNLFWTRAGSVRSCYFNSLEEAKKNIVRRKMEKDVKIIIHEI